MADLWGGLGRREQWTPRDDLPPERTQPNAPPEVEEPKPPREFKTKPPKFRPGDQVGHWTVLKFVPGSTTPRRLRAYYLCRCRCGQEREVRTCNLAAGISQSCGHIKRTNRSNA